MAYSLTTGRREGGLTLIELLISLAIGLVVLGSLLVVYLGSRAAYRTSDNLARVQEAGRFAVEFIAQEARMAGFMGCRSRNLCDPRKVDCSERPLPTDGEDETLTNITSPAIAFNRSGDGIRGFDGSDAASIAQWTNPTTVTRVGASDVITIRRGDGQLVSIASNSDPVARTVTLRHNAIGLRNGELAVLGNCEGAMLFYVTNSPAQTATGSFPTELQYKASGGGAVGNDTSIPVPSFNVGSRAEVMRVVETSYFVGSNAAGRPSLFRASGGAVEELIENVEDMDILYGIGAADATSGVVVEEYRRADQVADWTTVVSARISLLVAGPEDSITSSAQTYTFRESTGDGVADQQEATDRRLRHVFTTTISLRNRVL